MKVYKFLVKKIENNNVEIRAESYKRAVEGLLETLLIKNNKVLKKSNEKEDFYEMKLDNISNDFEESEDNIDEENIEETIDDLPKEYIEIVCEKCGNTIQLEDDLLS